MTIDGTSQSGFSGTPLIVLNGTNAGSNAIGLEILSGNSTVEDLVIDHFTADGIDLQTGGGNVITGNYIGVDSSGATAAGNGYNGVDIYASANNTIGGTTAAARNVISDNATVGVNLSGGSAGNMVEGNYIGTDVTGTKALGNEYGVFIDAASVNNTVGGTASGAGNFISASTQDGVIISDSGTSGNLVEGNSIGTDKNGTDALGNADGILIQYAATNNTIGGTAHGAANVIAGNASSGVEITSSGTSGNVVQGNYIGTNANCAALGNAADGVDIDASASNNTVGGTASGAGNVIAYSGNDGVKVDTGTDNAIRQNSIYDSTNLGIELVNNGNNNQPAPVLTSATVTSSSITITGTLQAADSTTYNLDFFANPLANPSGYGERQQFLGSATETNNSNSNSTINFTVMFNVSVPAGYAISATATDPNGNTSAFAQDVTAS